MEESGISNNKLLEIINVQTEVVQQGMELSSIMDLVTQRTQHFTDADGACVELIVKEELAYSAASGMAEKFLGLRLNMEKSLSGECIRTKIPLISNDIDHDNRVNKVACRKIGLHSMIVVPLIFKNDVVGVLKVLSEEVGHFNLNHIKILELMSGLIAAAMFSAMKNGESELFYKATHDSLTGISNRSLFYDRLRQRLSQALKKQESFGIISLDMDGLKEINDNYGHRAGDASIKEIALRINNMLCEPDTVSRLGGDEFGVIVVNSATKAHMNSLIEKMGCEIRKPFQFEKHNIDLRASIGYAVFSEDGIDLDTLIEKADQSMYEVKRRQKGTGNVR